jgi:hypothetical protein
VHAIEQPMAIKQHVDGEVGVNGRGLLCGDAGAGESSMCDCSKQSMSQ